MSAICPNCGAYKPDDRFNLCAECDAQRGISHNIDISNETLAYIEDDLRSRADVAERLADGTTHNEGVAMLLRSFADRIKAAAKREREARDDFRVALMAIVDALDAVGFKPWTCDDPLEVAYSAARAALEKHAGGARVWCKNDPTRHCVDCEICKGEGSDE